MHWKLTHRHHQVMRLVVSALNHDAHKAERLELGEWLCVARYNCEPHTIRQVITLCAPTDFMQLLNVRRNHAFNGLNRATFACHVELYPGVKHTRRRSSVKRNLVHID